MNVQVMSDIHVEFMRDGGRSFVDSLDPSDTDTLVLAGDLADSRTLIDALDRLCERFPQVVYVTGNHEYYGSDRETVHRHIEAVTARRPNLHWLENRAVELCAADGSRQRFVGCTLWFPDLPDGRNAEYGLMLNDFRQIRGFGEWVYAANAASMKFLTDEVRPGDVVVTHHLPDARAVHPRWRGSPLNRFFLCQMPPDVLARPRLWCFGHTHDSLRFSIGECDFVCNPFGYTRHEENPAFDDRLVVAL